MIKPLPKGSIKEWKKTKKKQTHTMREVNLLLQSISDEVKIALYCR